MLSFHFLKTVNFGNVRGRSREQGILFFYHGPNRLREIIEARHSTTYRMHHTFPIRGERLYRTLPRPHHRRRSIGGERRFDGVIVKLVGLISTAAGDVHVDEYRKVVHHLRPIGTPPPGRAGLHGHYSRPSHDRSQYGSQRIVAVAVAVVIGGGGLPPRKLERLRVVLDGPHRLSLVLGHPLPRRGVEEPEHLPAQLTDAAGTQPDGPAHVDALEARQYPPRGGVEERSLPGPEDAVGRSAARSQARAHLHERVERVRSRGRRRRNAARFRLGRGFRRRRQRGERLGSPFSEQ
mmetsp:Transcript_51285/g.154109  ORF Transcript_51285/g.154109 Transcript_51285/m.154109 type:complete len:293 (+) Transcript_51285:49-927(+)